MHKKLSCAEIVLLLVLNLATMAFFIISTRVIYKRLKRQDAKVKLHA